MRQHTKTQKKPFKKMSMIEQAISTRGRVDAMYPNASNKDKAAICNIILRCRRLKIKHIVDQ